MEYENNKTCAKSYRPGSAVCLDCGENEETVEQYRRCQKMYKSLDEAHEILEGVGLDAESRTCLLQKKQLVAIALLAERDKTLGGLSKTTLNKLARENRLLEIAQAHAQGIMTIEKAHQILKDIGLDADSRNCLAKNKQLIEMALLAKKDKTFSGLEKSVINELVKENRLLEIAQAHAKGIMTILKAHQVLKDIGLDLDSRNCLAKNEQLIEVANLAFIIKAIDANTLNRLAKEDCLLEVTIAVEKANRILLNVGINLPMLNCPDRNDRMLNFNMCRKQLKCWKLRDCPARNMKNLITCFGVAVERGKGKNKKTPQSEVINQIRNVYAQFITIERFANRYLKLSHEDNLLIKGEYIREILKHYHYNLTLNQLLSMSKNFKLSKKENEKICNMEIIHRQELNGTYLYAESENKFEQNWDSQIEYFSELFNRRSITKTKRLISHLAKNALLEKQWHLDEIYVSILISKVLQIPVNIHENITEKKTKG